MNNILNKIVAAFIMCEWITNQSLVG